MASAIEQMTFNHGFVNQLHLEDSSIICTAVIIHYNCFGFTWLTLSIADGHVNLCITDTRYAIRIRRHVSLKNDIVVV